MYHERLRIYFLQKLGEKEVQRLNQRIIYRLQKAISDQYKDEFEELTMHKNENENLPLRQFNLCNECN